MPVKVKSSLVKGLKKTVRGSSSCSLEGTGSLSCWMSPGFECMSFISFLFLLLLSTLLWPLYYRAFSSRKPEGNLTTNTKHLYEQTRKFSMKSLLENTSYFVVSWSFISFHFYSVSFSMQYQYHCTWNVLILIVQLTSTIIEIDWHLFCRESSRCRLLLQNKYKSKEKNNKSSGSKASSSFGDTTEFVIPSVLLNDRKFIWFLQAFKWVAVGTTTIKF